MNALDLIETKRIRLGLTHTALAAGIGLTRQHWHQLRNGRCHFTPRHLDALADLFGDDDIGRRALHECAARDAGYRI